jgi:flagellar biosynthesis component FlhA
MSLEAEVKNADARNKEEEVKVEDDNQKFKDTIISNCLKYHLEETKIPYSEESSKEELKQRLDILRKEYHEYYMRLLFEKRDEVQPHLDELSLKIKETIRRIDKIKMENIGYSPEFQQWI